MRKIIAAVVLIGVAVLAWWLWPRAPRAVQPPTATQPTIAPKRDHVPAPVPPARAATGAYGDTIGIPVLMFHRFEAQARNKFSITPEEFKRVLTALRDANFCPVTLEEYVRNSFPVACQGRKLFSLTFDDGHPTQFRFLPDGTVDPRSGLGVLLAVFPHPSATFFLNVRNGGRPFGPDSKRKLEYLRKHGLEIGDHTVSHPFLNRLSDASVAREVGRACGYFGMKRTMLAYPYGVPPRKPITAYQTGCAITAAFRAWLGFFEGIPRGQSRSTGPLLAPLPASSEFEAMRYTLPRLNIHNLTDLQRDVLWNPGVYRLPADIEATPLGTPPLETRTPPGPTPRTP